MNKGRAKRQIKDPQVTEEVAELILERTLLIALSIINLLFK